MLQWQPLASQVLTNVFTSLLENSLLTLPAQKTLQITLQRNVDSIQIGIQLSRVIINCLNEQAKLRSRIMILNHAFVCNPNFRPKIWSETSRLNMSVKLVHTWNSTDLSKILVSQLLFMGLMRGAITHIKVTWHSQIIGHRFSLTISK